MVLFHRRQSLSLDLETETRGKLHRPHHPDGVFLKADFGVADGADDLLLDILHPADPVDYAEILNVVKKTVHGKIASVRVGLGRPEGVVFERAFRGVFDYFADRLGVAPERRRLDDFPARESDMGKTESAPDQKAVFAKCIGMEGNRRFGESIYAGPIFITRDNHNSGLCSLTDEQVQKYSEMFAEPQDISQDEVQADMGFTFIPLW